MKASLYIIITGILLLILGCDENTGEDSEIEYVVIQAYLFEGEEVDDIKLTKTIPLGDETDIETPINDAYVELVKGSQIYPLVASEGDSGFYHYPGDDLIVLVNEEFTINVDYFEKTATGTTTVPLLPQGVSLSTDTLEIPQVLRVDLFKFDTARHQTTVSWENDSNAMFFIAIRNIEEDPDSVILRLPPRGLPGRMVSLPMNQDSYPILFEDISHYGWHEVTLYRINQEYVDLYISRHQNSRELNEPLTNITDGLGIFSAFSSTSLYFNAIKE